MVAREVGAGGVSRKGRGRGEEGDRRGRDEGGGGRGGKRRGETLKLGWSLKASLASCRLTLPLQ